MVTQPWVHCLGQLSSTGISAALGVHDHTPVVATVYAKMHMTMDFHRVNSPLLKGPLRTSEGAELPTWELLRVGVALLRSEGGCSHAAWLCYFVRSPDYALTEMYTELKMLPKVDNFYAQLYNYCRARSPPAFAGGYSSLLRTTDATRCKSAPTPELILADALRDRWIDIWQPTCT